MSHRWKPFEVTLPVEAAALPRRGIMVRLSTR